MQLSESQEISSKLDRQYKISMDMWVLTLLNNLRGEAIVLEGLDSGLEQGERRYFRELYYLNSQKKVCCVQEDEEIEPMIDRWLICSDGMKSSQHFKKEKAISFQRALRDRENVRQIEDGSHVSKVFFQRILSRYGLSISLDLAFVGGSASSQKKNTPVVVLDKKFSIITRAEFDQEVFVLSYFPERQALMLEFLDLEKREHCVEVYSKQGNVLRKRREHQRTFSLSEARRIVQEDPIFNSQDVYSWNVLYFEIFRLKNILDSDSRAHNVRQFECTSSLHASSDSINFERLLEQNGFELSESSRMANFGDLHEARGLARADRRSSDQDDSCIML